MAMRRMRRFRRRSRPFRRTTLRRRYGRKRPRSLRDRFQATSDINRGGWNFKRKRFNPKAYRKALWRSSEAGQKYRTANAVASILATPLNRFNMNAYWIARIQDSGGGSRFWQDAGGLYVGNEVPVTTDFGGSDLFIRGGVTRILFSNPIGGFPVRVCTWLAKTTQNGTPPANPFGVPQGWDPSLPDEALLPTDPNRDVYKFYTFWGAQDTILKPGEVFERSVPIKAQKVDQDQWINTRGRDFWIVAVQNVATNNTLSVDCTTSWNASFTGDRVV